MAALAGNKSDTLVNSGDQVKDEKTGVVTQFGRHWNKLRSLLEKYWPTLMLEKRLEQILGQQPVLIAIRAPTLGDILVHSEYVPTHSSSSFLSKTLKGMFRCGHCIMCIFVHKTDVFWDSELKRYFTIRSFLNCSAKWVVYIVMCPFPKINVGKTKRRSRIGE